MVGLCINGHICCCLGEDPACQGYITLFLCGSKLEKVDVFKYLGVIINANLSPSDRINDICNKARKILGFVNRQFYQDSSPSTLRALYITLVRPRLEYAAKLWDPHTHCEVNKLEAVQRFTLRVVSHQWDSTYEDLLNIVKIQKLQERRLKLKLSQVYNIMHGLNLLLPIQYFCAASITSSETGKTPHHVMPSCP